MAVPRALTLTSGSKSSTLYSADLQRFPGSLFESLGKEVDAGGTIDVDSLPGNPFGSWDALPLTLGLYRDGHFPASTLSELLTDSSSQDLLERLRVLLDFLRVEERLSLLLPAVVPLQHVGVRVLRCHAVAAEAVNTVLGSSAFYTGSKVSAAFLIMAPQEGEPQLTVYGLEDFEGDTLCSLLDPTGRARPACCGPLVDVMHDLIWGDGKCIHGEAVGEQHPLAAFLATAFEAALCKVPVDGRTGCIKAECVKLSEALEVVNGCCTQMPVWRLSW